MTVIASRMSPQVGAVAGEGHCYVLCFALCALCFALSLKEDTLQRKEGIMNGKMEPGPWLID